MESRGAVESEAFDIVPSMKTLKDAVAGFEERKKKRTRIWSRISDLFDVLNIMHGQNVIKRNINPETGKKESEKNVSREGSGILVCYLI